MRHAVTDALGREVQLARGPRRIVSLVPSETESVAILAGLERLVGRTDYCIEPAPGIASIASVGGTKGFSVERVRELEPDLVLTNKEENARPRVEALIAAGLTVHVSFPTSVLSSLRYLESLATLLDVDVSTCEPIARARDLVARGPVTGARRSVFVPIWRDPWMTFDHRSYASDVLSWAGAENVFANRPRLYPLRADLGDPGVTVEATEERDDRYPRVTMVEICSRRPELILLPDEPFQFTLEHIAEFQREALLSDVRVELVDGKYLFWYGARMVEGLTELAQRIAAR